MSQDDRPLPHDVRSLQALLLQRETTLVEQREALAQKESVIAAQHDTISELHRKIKQQEHYLAQLLRRQYGPQRERIDPDQLLLFTKDELNELIADLNSEAEESADQDDENSTDDKSDTRPKPKPQGHGRKPLPKDLPREQVVYEVPAEELDCPCCGGTREEIGSESSEQLEFVPAVLKVIEHIRKKYACRHCAEHVTIAAKAPQPIEKGLPGPGLLAHTVLGKYGDHLPLCIVREITVYCWVLRGNSILVEGRRT